MSRSITSLLHCKGAGALERGHYNCLVGDTLILCNEELKQQRRQRLRERHLGSKFVALFHTLSFNIRQMLANFLELNSKTLY